MLSRRSFQGLVVTSATAVAAGIVAIPSLITGLYPALQKRERNAWRPVGPLKDFPLRQVRPATAMLPENRWPRPTENAAVFVWRPAVDEVIVFSRACTDLACPLNYDSGSGCYFCPCHGGIFAKDGTVMAGPPPRPMQRYAVRVRDGLVEIDVASLPKSTEGAAE